MKGSMCKNYAKGGLLKHVGKLFVVGPPSFCCNLNLGLVTKVRVCKVAGQEGSRESHNILLGM